MRSDCKMSQEQTILGENGPSFDSVCLALPLWDMVLLYSVWLITGALSVLSVVDDVQVDMRRTSLVSSSRRPTVSTWGWTACRNEWTCWQWRSHSWTPPWRKVDNKHCCCVVSVTVTTFRHPHWCFWMIPTLFTMTLDRTTARVQSHAPFYPHSWTTSQDIWILFLGQQLASNGKGTSHLFPASTVAL